MTNKNVTGNHPAVGAKSNVKLKKKMALRAIIVQEWPETPARIRNRLTFSVFLMRLKLKQRYYTIS